jgi:dTDP-4-amino-4,6-dideoxygalactose transaminase
LIPFNKPYLTGMETEYIKKAADFSKLSGDGNFTRKCHAFFEQRYGFQKALLTTSCTDALEMAAILLDIQPGDEVIVPSFTFVSTANAFVLRGARIIFADSNPNNPNIDVTKIEDLITPRTKAIVPVHYAGIACDMNAIMDLAYRYNLFVVEDSAQAIDSFYTGPDGVKRPLGSIGHLAAFSFHETKNIFCGEGGMLTINDERFIQRAEIIWEKGTNRSAFFRGEVNKYDWVDIGSSFLPSEILAAFLWAQLENLDLIQNRRREIWNMYYAQLTQMEQEGSISLPVIPDYATHNAHIFYLICRTPEIRTHLTGSLKNNQIYAISHYLPLHNSSFYKNKYKGMPLPWSEHYTDKLLRLPFFFEITEKEVEQVTRSIKILLGQNENYH